jgi:hypothetical protein
MYIIKSKSYTQTKLPLDPGPTYAEIVCKRIRDRCDRVEMGRKRGVSGVIVSDLFGIFLNN